MNIFVPLIDEDVVGVTMEASCGWEVRGKNGNFGEKLDEEK
jgi:hypothetical protein